MRWGLAILLFFSVSGCFQRANHHDEKSCKAQKVIYPKYSKRFVMEYYNGFRTLSVLRPEDSSFITGYVVYPKGKPVPKGFERFIAVDDQFGKMVCLSTTHVAAIRLLQQESKIAAVANASLIFDTVVQTLIQNQKIVSVGKDFNPEIEKIILLHPDIVFTDAENGSGIGVLGKIQEAKIPLVISNDYKEQSPLARAEWIKFFAFFLNAEEKADSLFSIVEQEYTAIAQLPIVKRPTVFCNYPYQGIWYTPASKSYFTQLMTDAGGQYVFADRAATNGLNLSLNFEQLFGVAQHADVWLLTSADKTLSGLQRIDEKFSWFDAFKKEQVFSAAKRSNSNGGIDYWESACFLPHLALRDLHQIFAHQHVSDDSLFYFNRLKP
jgi:iron complex transport system substrate-binding protein